MRNNGAVWRALAAARRANLAAVGIAAPIAASPALTRRTLLAGLGGAGLGAALPAASPPRPAGRVAIIGGGIAGLTALHHLRAAGVDAWLYEARRRLGGRMHTRAAQDGAPAFERGGQLVNTDHADILALAARHGVALVDRKAGPHATLILSDGRVVPEGELAAGLRGIAAAIDADAVRLDRDFKGHAPRIDRLSIAGYLDAHASLIPEGWVRRLLEQTSRTEYGVEPDRASALGLVFNLPVVDGTRVEVLGGSDEAHVIAGGSSALIAAMAARLTDRIETARRVIRIEGAAGGPLTLTFLDLSRITVDRVIVAVPAPLARYIEYAAPLAPDWRAFLQVMQTGRNEKAQFAMRDPGWHGAMGAGGEAWTTDAGAPAALAWDGTVRGGAAEGPVWTCFLGGGQVPDSGDGVPTPAALADAFAAVQPGLADRRATGFAFDRTGWCRDPLTMGSYATYPPGQLTRFGHLLWREGAPARTGRILFAGEHLSDAFPGYMNGAAETGRLAAAAVLGRRIAA